MSMSLSKDTPFIFLNLINALALSFGISLLMDRQIPIFIEQPAKGAHTWQP